MTEKTSAKNTLLAAAAALFREKGYDRTTVRDLAKAVGLQSGSLFYHFRNKEEILTEVMRDGILAVTEAVTNAIDNRQPPVQQLQAMAQAHLEMLLGPSQDALAVMLYEWRSLPADARAGILQLRNTYENLWSEKMQLAADNGQILGDVGSKRRFLLGALNWSSNWFSPDGELTVSDLAHEAITMIVSAGTEELTAGD